MKLLVGTLADCFVYDVDTREKTRVQRPTAGNRAAYGITWGGKYAYIGWREPSEVAEYDRDLKPTGRLVITDAGHEFRPGEKGSAPHQMMYANQLLLLANTGKDEIVAFEIGGLRQVDSWSPRQIEPAYMGAEYHHLNSVFAWGKELYVVAHMAGARESQAWTLSPDGPLHDSRVRNVRQCGTGAHNVFPLNEGLASCASMDSQVVHLGSEKQVVYQGPRDRLFRGVCYAGNAFVLGWSAFEKKREDRRHAAGGLYVWRSGPFQGEPEEHVLDAGPVCEVRCLDMSDRAHPNGRLWR